MLVTLEVNMEKEHVQVLLASTPQTLVKEIEAQLEQTIGLDCHLFQCGGLAECLNHLHKDPPHFDIVLLDMTLLNIQESENFLREIQEAAHDIPVIVFTREEDRELAMFIVGEGASIVSNPQKFKLDTNRLRDVIEYSWIRYKKSRKKSENHASALRAERSRSALDLKKEKEAGANRLKEKDHVISWMSGGYSFERDSEQDKTNRR